jgi:iron complex outermembrane receptor protein
MKGTKYFCEKSKHNQMIKYLSIVAGVLLSLNSLAQTGSIKGSVTFTDGNPTEFVNVYIKGTTTGVNTDKEGKFTLEKVVAGNHTLVASSIGFKTSEKLLKLSSYLP